MAAHPYIVQLKKGILWWWDNCRVVDEVKPQKDNLGHTALHLAASQGHVAVCSILLASPRFKAVNAKDWKGWTALHCAAEQGQDEAWPGMAHVL
eukprot:symbB.v1.2.032406.t1/scaffold3890.1/size48796/4